MNAQDFFFVAMGVAALGSVALCAIVILWPRGRR